MKKLSINQLRKHFDGMSHWEVQKHIPNDIYMSRQGNKNILSKLVIACNKVPRADRTFENKTDEIPYAAKMAKNMLEVAYEIRNLVDKVDASEAETAIEILQVCNIMFIRMFGDQLTKLIFEGKNLEDWFKSIYCDEQLVEKARFYHNIETLHLMGWLPYEIRMREEAKNAEHAERKRMREIYIEEKKAY
jgi:hypothetical protein